jgi:hypothetical protein
VNPNLAAVVRIKTMALAAADGNVGHAASAAELADAYDRLRQLALELWRAWGMRGPSRARSRR